MINKQEYRDICKRERNIPIFSKDWWLDAVAGKNNWDVILIEKGGDIIAALPYYFKKKYTFKIITNPPFTQNFLLWIKYPEYQKYEKKLSYEKEIIYEIVDKLPKFDMFRLDLYYSLSNWLPFYWKGFEQTTKYTYVIEDIKDLHRILNNFSHAKRKNIKKAEKIVEVRTDLPAIDFYENHKLTLKKQNEKISYSFDTFKNIYNAVYMHNCGKVFYALDKKNNLHAALLIIWDDIQAYDLISTIDPDFRTSGATSLLIREAIKYTADKTTKFDFEGSMIESVENSFRQFGTIQKQYFNIKKINSKLLKIVLCFMDILKK